MVHVGVEWLIEQLYATREETRYHTRFDALPCSDPSYLLRDDPDGPLGEVRAEVPDWETRMAALSVLAKVGGRTAYEAIRRSIRFRISKRGRGYNRAAKEALEGMA